MKVLNENNLISDHERIDMTAVETSKVLGIDKHGDTVYGIKGCRHYCLEPVKGFIYIQNENKKLEETSFLHLGEAEVCKTGKTLNNVIVDKRSIYIEGNKFLKFHRLDREITTLNDFEYSVVLGRGRGFDPEAIKDRDIQDFLSLLDDQDKEKFTDYFGEADEHETILFIKFRGWISLVTKGNDSMPVTCFPTTAITESEKELSDEYIIENVLLIVKRGLPLFDESSIVDIQKEDQVYDFTEIKKEIKVL